MTHRFRIWEDLGREGRAPETVQLEYHPERAYSFPEHVKSTVEDVWESAKDERERLFNSPGLNLLRVTDGCVHLGPAQFRDYFVRRLFLSGEINDSPDELSALLRRSVRLLSSFVGVVVRNKLLLGIKQTDTDGAGILSLPGSGYLDREMDMECAEMRPTSSVIKREIEEEINITDPDKIRCIGVFEDLHPQSHLNPALFSIVSIDRPQSAVQRAARDAEDAHEFSRLVFVPLTDQTLSSLVRLDIDEAASLGEAECLPHNKFDRLSHKTLLMLLLLGRYQLGTDWFSRECDRYPSLRFEDPT